MKVSANSQKGRIQQRQRTAYFEVLHTTYGRWPYKYELSPWKQRVNPAVNESQSG
jgi:hypothetical protein